METQQKQRCNRCIFTKNASFMFALFLVSLFSVNLSLLAIKKRTVVFPHTVNSESFSSLNAHNEKQAGSLNTYDSWGLEMIQMENAWLLSQGNSNVRVGIIDTGVWSEHVDLQDNLNFGYDVCFSQDFSTSMYDTTNNGHGTKVTGIIGASHNNIGIDGVCKQVSITPYRVSHSFYLDDNLWYQSACIDSLYDAELQGIEIINFSGSGFSEPIEGFFDAFDDFSGLIVCAAGNDYINCDISYNTPSAYPSSFDLDNIISVSASNEDDQAASFSNYGFYSVDLFAPGEDILSTTTFDNYSSDNGTSFAAPYVTGTIALMKSVNPSLTNSQIKHNLITTVDCSNDYYGLCVSGGRLNAYKAVKASIPTISLGTNSCIQPLDTNDFQWYTFTTQAGSYLLSSSGNLDLAASLYTNPLGSPIATATPDYSGNFSINFTNYNNETAQRYYLKVSNLSELLTGTYSIALSSIHTHSYNHHYVNVGLRHKSYCSCGDYIVQPHFMVTDFNGNRSCVLCGGSGGLGTFSIYDGMTYTIIGDNSLVLNDGTIILSNNDYQNFLNNPITITNLLMEEN